MKHVWIGDDHRFLVTDNFDETPGSEDMQALAALSEYLREKAKLTPEQAERQDVAIARTHERMHNFRCCAVHGTHTMPHRGCILR